MASSSSLAALSNVSLSLSNQYANNLFDETLPDNTLES